MLLILPVELSTTVGMVVYILGAPFARDFLFKENDNFLRIIPLFSDKSVQPELIIINIVIEISGSSVPPCDNYLIHRVKIFSIFCHRKRFIFPYCSE